MAESKITKQNKSLKQISKMLFGDSAEMRIVAPGSLKFLDQNARYFKKEIFKQLISNLKEDQRLSSMPLCHILEGGKLEVLSGNHRVKASIEANIEHIIVLVILGDLSKSEQLSIQLFHNALVGVDDQQILSDLWGKIDSIKDRLYSGLNSQELGELKKIKLISFTTPQIRTRRVSFVFTDDEQKDINQTLSDLAAIPADEIHMTAIDQFDQFFALLQAVKKKDDIKNSSLAMLRLIEIGRVYIDCQEVA